MSAYAGATENLSAYAGATADLSAYAEATEGFYKEARVVRLVFRLLVPGAAARANGLVLLATPEDLFGLAAAEHHGIEVLLPGPCLLLRYRGR